MANKSGKYLAVVEKAKDCVAGLGDRTDLNPQRIVDDVIARCGGDIDKAKAAFEAYKPQVLITSRELGIRLRLTAAEVDSAVRRGQIPFIAVADEVRFDFQDVIQKLKQKNSKMLENI